MTQPTNQYTITVTSPMPFDETIAAAREELAEVGFGIMTEIDMQATLKTKLGADVPSTRILGACKPPFAHRAVTAEPSVAALLPCNVVVRETGNEVLVEAFDPAAMARLSAAPGLDGVAADARADLTVALDRIAARRPAIAGGV